MRGIVVHEPFAVCHLAGDPVIVDPFAAIRGHEGHALGHGTGVAVEVIPPAIAAILTFDHVAIGVITYPFAAIRTQIDVFVAGHGAIAIDPVPIAVLPVIDLPGTNHFSVLVVMLPTLIPTVLRFGRRDRFVGFDLLGLLRLLGFGGYCRFRSHFGIGLRDMRTQACHTYRQSKKNGSKRHCLCFTHFKPPTHVFFSMPQPGSGQISHWNATDEQPCSKPPSFGCHRPP